MPEYRFTLKSCANPDHGEIYPPAEPVDCVAETLEQISRQISAYVDENLLGGGNFPEVQIFRHYGDAGEWFARGSYNGRIWAEKVYTPGSTPLWPRQA